QAVDLHIRSSVPTRRSSDLAFAYIPLVKLSGQPLIAYRLPPRFIIKGLCKRLGVQARFRKFKDPMAGARALEEAIDAGELVGLQDRKSTRLNSSHVKISYAV